MTDPRYPIGKNTRKDSLTDAERKERIAQIADAPRILREAVRGLNGNQLDTQYRPDGWTVRQVVHHLPDSHINAYARIRLALTETEPTIKPYEEALWAELPDARTMPIDASLQLFDALHARWTVLWNFLRPTDFAKTLRHPEAGIMTLDTVLNMYAWHGRHHAAQITTLRERMGWK